MAATINGSSVTWGMTAETGTLVQSSRKTQKVDDKRYRNHEGQVSSIVMYNPHTEWSIEFIPLSTSTSGLSAIAPAVAQTMANIAETGIEIPLEVNIELNNEDALKITASGVIHPLITS